MKKWWIVLIIIAAVIAFLLSILIYSSVSLYNCKVDEDCISVTAGCCGCNHGGSKTSINQKYLWFYEKKRDLECVARGCLMMISQDWSCWSSEPKCVNNKCQLVKTN